MWTKISKLHQSYLNFSYSLFQTNKTKPIYNARQKMIKYNSYLLLNPRIEDQCKSIIKEIEKEKVDIQQLHKMMERYLESYIGQSNRGQRNIDSILSLLGAIHFSRIETLYRYKSKLVEQTNRITIEDPQEIQGLASDLISTYIIATSQYRKTTNEKMKNTRIFYNLMTVLQMQFSKVHYSQYWNILAIVCKEDKFHPNLLKIARLLQHHISIYFSALVKGSYFKANQMQMFTSSFLCYCAEMFKIYGAFEKQDFVNFYRYLTEKYLPNLQVADNNQSIFIINSLYRNFNYQEKNEAGLYYKELFLQFIITNFIKKHNLIEAYTFGNYGHHFCSTILMNRLYQFANTLTYHNDGNFSFLAKASLKGRPELPDIFWDIYNKNPSMINNVSSTNGIIKDIFPEKYIYSQGKVIETIEPFLETEMKIRVEEALKQLNYKYEREINISGKYIDFLLEENVVLQIDGMQHFCLNSLEMTDKTVSRNIHLILAGYRLIIVNIYEYNMHREVKDIKALIQAKKQSLQSNEALIVF